MGSYDFGGWATRNDLKCSDGRTIRRDAFKDNNGCKVPLVWNHEHNDPNAVLGHAMLENRDDGVYAYGKFNDTEQGQHAKKLLQNGDIRSLSIWANQLKQIGSDVMHGNIRELSLVLSGANPGAYVDFVMAHSEGEEDTMYASYDENITLYHSDEPKEKKGEPDMGDDNKAPENSGSKKTIQEIIDSMTDEQQEVMYAMVGQALEENDIPDDNSDEEEDEMKHNVFDKEEMQPSNVLSHSDEEAIISLAKQSGIGNLKSAMEIYAEENFGDTLAHGVFTDADTEKLFPEYANCVSMALTPMTLTARLIKNHTPDAKVVFIGPCAAKKLEAMRRTVRSEVDFVLTFEEMSGIFAAKDLDLEAMHEDVDGVNDVSADGRNFAVSGGVAQAVVDVIKKEYPDKEIKVANAEGLEECRKLMMMASKGKYNGYLLEGMACPGGCVAGAGTMQPIKKSQGAVKIYATKANHKVATETEYVKELDKLVD